MNRIALSYKKRLTRYPDEDEVERWDGVALDFYLRTGTVPYEVLHYKARALADTRALKYRPDQPRVPAGNPDGGQWTAEGGSLTGTQNQSKPSKFIRVAGEVIEVCVGSGFSEAIDKYGNSLGWTITYDCADGYSFTVFSKKRTGLRLDPRKGSRL
jgi:hypothetical protein